MGRVIVVVIKDRIELVSDDDTSLSADRLIHSEWSLVRTSRPLSLSSPFSFPRKAFVFSSKNSCVIVQLSQLLRSRPSDAFIAGRSPSMHGAEELCVNQTKPAAVFIAPVWGPDPLTLTFTAKSGWRLPFRDMLSFECLLNAPILVESCSVTSTLGNVLLRSLVLP